MKRNFKISSTLSQSLHNAHTAQPHPSTTQLSAASAAAAAQLSSTHHSSAQRAFGLVSCKGGDVRMPDGSDAVRALSHEQVRQIVARFEALNPYDRRLVPGSILNVVEEINFDSAGKQRHLYGYGISAKRYALFTHEDSKIKLIKASEHGLRLYYRPKEGRDSECEVALWIKEGWEWILNRGARTTLPGTGLVPLARYEANCHQHPKRDGCVTQA